MPPPVRGPRILPVGDPFPGGLDQRIRRAHRIVVEVPAAGDEVIEDLGEQAPLAVVGQVVDAHRGHHGVQHRRDAGRPLPAGRHVELGVPVAAGERLHLALAGSHHLG